MTRSTIPMPALVLTAAALALTGCMADDADADADAVLVTAPADDAASQSPTAERAPGVLLDDTWVSLPFRAEGDSLVVEAVADGPIRIFQVCVEMLGADGPVSEYCGGYGAGAVRLPAPRGGDGIIALRAFVDVRVPGSKGGQDWRISSRETRANELHTALNLVAIGVEPMAPIYLAVRVAHSLDAVLGGDDDDGEDV